VRGGKVEERPESVGRSKREREEGGGRGWREEEGGRGRREREEGEGAKEGGGRVSTRYRHKARETETERNNKMPYSTPEAWCMCTTCTLPQKTALQGTHRHTHRHTDTHTQTEART
jgi:hypothetical protein